MTTKELERLKEGQLILNRIDNIKDFIDSSDTTGEVRMTYSQNGKLTKLHREDAYEVIKTLEGRVQDLLKEFREL